MVHPDIFGKLDFEIAVDQQTRARDRAFKGVPDSGCPPVNAGQPRLTFQNWLAQSARLTIGFFLISERILAKCCRTQSDSCARPVFLHIFINHYLN